MMRSEIRFSFAAMILGLSLGLTVLLPSSSAVSQQQDRLVTKKPWRAEPVKIAAVKTKNKENIEIGSAFDEDEDWLDGFRVTVVNNYDKTVTAMTIAMVFRREPGDTRPPFAWNLHFGPSPNSSEYIYRDPNRVVRVGKTADLRLSPQDYQTVKHGLEQTGYPNSIRRVELVIREVGFEDGSMLYSGTFYLQDPANPNDPTKKIKAPRRGAQNNRSPPERKNIMSASSFVKASLTLPNPMQVSLTSPYPTRVDPDCRAQEPPRLRSCPPSTVCNQEVDVLAPFQVGPNQLEFQYEHCERFVGDGWLNCLDLINEVERFAFCEAEIPCGTQ